MYPVFSRNGWNRSWHWTGHNTLAVHQIQSYRCFRRRPSAHRMSNVLIDVTPKFKMTHFTTLKGHSQCTKGLNCEQIMMFIYSYFTIYYPLFSSPSCFFLFPFVLFIIPPKNSQYSCNFLDSQLLPDNLILTFHLRTALINIHNMYIYSPSADKNRAAQPCCAALQSA